ncbi:hypothetical protein [Oscillibacter sp.]|uniref:hypothetical protein n=1 Tax=Oscillibacter sp. TaxID=1945593 RepID=UPI002896C056|nr:hypothetical protein [Oscillibacter sp.]
MKKIIASTIAITACAVLYAPVWPRSDAGEKVPAKVTVSATSAECVEAAETPDPALTMWPVTETTITAEKEEPPAADEQPADNTPDATMPTAPEPEPDEIQQAAATTITASAAVGTSDPYHTDIYPDNVYSEEYLYDDDGNLIGKTITIPTEFGPDTIWIDGHAYYDVLGFGLVEWSGPNQQIEDYTMYESGSKVGIMGGEDEAPANSTPREEMHPTGL